MATVTIDDIPYTVPTPVAELLLAVSEERDDLEEAMKYANNEYEWIMI